MEKASGLSDRGLGFKGFMVQDLGFRFKGLGVG